MRKNKGKILSILLVALSTISIGVITYAHSGRTDSSGGHRDNKNKSGLGSYHYHCGGYPAHLHDSGVCPYSSSSTKSKLTSSSTKTTTKTSTVAIKEIQINEEIESIEVGETIILTTKITPSNSTDKKITWKSSDENIAIVSSTGKIVALEPGEVSITVGTSNGKTDTIEIIIKEVKEIKEDNKNNTIVVPIQSNSFNSTIANTTEDLNAISGVIGLGLIGGGSYLGYKKYKKSKE